MSYWQIELLMKTTLLLSLLALFHTSSFYFPSSGLDHFESYHASILAKNNQAELSDWDLNAGVASMRVFTFAPGKEPEPYFNMLYEFDPKGRLVFWMQGDSSSAKYNYKYKTYAFGEAGQVQKVSYYEKSQNTYRMTKTFDQQGYLSEIRYQSETDSSLDFRTNIQYGAGHTKMKVAYNYDHAQTVYERRKTENYQFTFDNKGYLIKESKQGMYAYTTTYKRDAQTGLITYSHHLDACYPSNSCVNLTTRFKYDKAGNLVSTSADDRTVRNSLWTLGDHFEAKYNDQNLLIERTVFKTSGMGTRFPFNRAEINEAHRFEYSFDEAGNWIEQREYLAEKLLKTIKRELTYY